MLLRRLSLVGLVTLAMLASAAFAAEESEPAGEGEGKKSAAPQPKEEKEFNDKTSRLNSLSTRIGEAEKLFQELVRRKAGEKDPDEKKRIINQMLEATKDRNKSADEYMKLKSELALRYPNKGEHLNRRYQTQAKKSVEELEGAAGLDELLTRTKKSIEKKFATFSDPDADKKSEPSTKHSTENEEKPKRLRLEK